MALDRAINQVAGDDANGAAILYMVSGGWVSRWAPPEQMADRFQFLLDKGFTVVVVRHGSSPRYLVPDAVSDVRRAVRFVRYHAKEWGIDASRTFGLAIPLHTHNAALQLWLELGSVGAALAAAFFAWIVYRIVAWTGVNRRDGAMAAATLVSYLVIGGLSFGIWQEWWLALGAIAAIACGMAQKTGVSRR